MKRLRKIIQIDEELCNGCGLCVPDCAEGSLRIIDGKARLVADNLCDGLGACLGACPTGALRIIEREAEDFSEEAVHAFLAGATTKEDAVTEKQVGEHCGCPSTQIQTFIPPSTCQTGNQPTGANAAISALTHWPVQIRLVPPSAPFLRNAHLLVAADCATIAAANFQADFLAGKVVMMGCPKFDDAKSYVQRFADIFATCDLRRLTILIMEVPCCSSMIGIIKAAMEQAGTTVPVEQITLSTRGEITHQQVW